MDDISIPEEIGALMRNVTHTHCVAILAKQAQGAMYQCGTATLFEVAGQRFLVSAGHVVNESLKNHAVLLVHNGIPKSQVIPLKSRPWVAFDSQFDLAIWRLNDEEIAPLKEGKTFANQTNVMLYGDMQQLPRNELYYLCGFPTMLTEFDPDDEHHLIIDPIRWVARQATTDAILPEGCNLKYHIVLDSKSAIKLDADDSPMKPPRIPEGISGSGIWSVNLQRILQDTWAETDPKLVAIQTCVDPSLSIIRGTGWTGIKSILMQAYPELGMPLRMFGH